MKWSWFPTLVECGRQQGRCRCVANRLGFPGGGELAWWNARNVPETLNITCSFLILLARWLMGSETSGTYTDPTGGPLFLFSSELGIAKSPSSKDCAAPPKEENLTISLQRSKPALFWLN